MASYLRIIWAFKNTFEAMDEAQHYLETHPDATGMQDPVTRHWYINSTNPLDLEATEHIEKFVNISAQDLIDSIKTVLIVTVFYAPLASMAMLHKTFFDGYIMQRFCSGALYYFWAIETMNACAWFIRMLWQKSSI